MKEEEARKLAEAHWKYTEKIILLMLELTKYSYIEAMVHGFKHGEKR